MANLSDIRKASASKTGLLTNDAQTITGAKSFSSVPYVPGIDLGSARFGSKGVAKQANGTQYNYVISELGATNHNMYSGLFFISCHNDGTNAAQYLVYVAAYNTTGISVNILGSSIPASNPNIAITRPSASTIRFTTDQPIKTITCIAEQYH